jgi:DNA-binding CsgD family transcriptional regulator
MPLRWPGLGITAMVQRVTLRDLQGVHWCRGSSRAALRHGAAGGWRKGRLRADRPWPTRTAGGTWCGCWRLTGAWGSDLLTDLFAPETDAGTGRVLAHYQRAAAPAETAVALLGLAYDLDVRPALARITAPTLVLHRRGARAASAAQSRALAEAIADAELVELEGRSHLPAMGDAEAVVDHVRRFLGLPRLRRAVPTSLIPRQTEVAALVADGLTNRELAERLGISERSAESHLERIRLRLGFRSRSQVAAWYVAREPHT